MNDYSIIRNKISEIKSLELDYEEKEKLVFELTESIETPMKEYFRIDGYLNDNYYSVPKAKREYLLGNAPLCLESEILEQSDKNKIYNGLLNVYLKEYQYEQAEKIASKLITLDLNDSSQYYHLSSYYINTRRYEIADTCLKKALELSNHENLKANILNKKNELEKRKNGEMAEYQPAMKENRIKYQQFMESIGMDSNLVKPKTRVSDKKKAKETNTKSERTIKPRFRSFVAFDLETTGVNHLRDSITEIAAIRVVDGKILETKEYTFQELVHPYQQRIPRRVEQITGITNEMVADCREVWEVFTDFAKWVGNDILIGYNCMSFDCKFLAHASELSHTTMTNEFFDVLYYARQMKHKINASNNTLTAVSSSLNIVNPQAHRALADAITTAKVYLKLLDMEG